MKLLRTLSAKSSEITVSELAEVIQKDPVILAKVLGVANTMGYNPGGIPVGSVDQAVQVIGYARIQALAMSLMLVEQTARTQTSDEQKETTLLALASGCIARTAAQKRPDLDPDRAFVFALLRNFGRIVMATCMLDEFREAKRLVGELTDDESFRRIFGLTPVQLGRQLLKASDLPDDILAVLRELPPTVFEVLDAEPDEQLLMLADFSSHLAAECLATKKSRDDFAESARKLADGYQNALPGLAAEIPLLVDGATRQLDSFARTFELKGLPATGMSRLKQRRAEVDPRHAPPSPRAGVGIRAPVPGAEVGVAPKAAPAAAKPAEGVELIEGTHRVAVPVAEAVPEGVELVAAGAPRAAPAAAASTAVANPPPAAAVAAPPRDSPVTPPVVPADDGANFDWQVLIGRMTALLRKPGTTRAVLFRALLESVREGFGAPECMLFTGQPGKTDFRLTFGHGKLYEPLQIPARLTVRDRTVFGVCLSRNENIIVHHANDAKITPYLPGWLGSPPALGAFALLPLSDGKKPYGVVLAGWPEPRSIHISPDQVRLIRTLLTFACQAGARLAA